MTTTNAPLETFQLGPFTVPRLFNGLWQLSSNAWGSAPTPKIRRQMAHYAEHGYTAFGKRSYAGLRDDPLTNPPKTW